MSVLLSIYISILLSFSSITVESTDVICNQIKACEGQNITTDGNVICSRFQACIETFIKAAGDVTCSGGSSCSPHPYFTWSTGTGTKPYTIESGGTVTCSGSDSCRRSKIKADVAVIFSGYDAGKRMMVRSPYIEATGEQTIAKAMFIDSGEYPTMTVKLADKGSSRNPGAILCRQGAVCNVLCESKKGCMNFRYGCRAGATCNIEPVECLDTANWDKEVTNGHRKQIMCPLEITGLSTSSAVSQWFDALDFTDDDEEDGEFDLDDKWRNGEEPMTLTTSQYMWVAVTSAATSMMVVLIAYILCIKQSQKVQQKVFDESYTD